MDSPRSQTGTALSTRPSGQQGDRLRSLWSGFKQWLSSTMNYGPMDPLWALISPPPPYSRSPRNGRTCLPRRTRVEARQKAAPRIGVQQQVKTKPGRENGGQRKAPRPRLALRNIAGPKRRAGRSHLPPCGRAPTTIWVPKHSIIEAVFGSGNRPCAISCGPRLGLSIWWRWPHDK